MRPQPPTRHKNAPPPKEPNVSQQSTVLFSVVQTPQKSGEKEPPATKTQQNIKSLEERSGIESFHHTASRWEVWFGSYESLPTAATTEAWIRDGRMDDELRRHDQWQGWGLYDDG